MRGFYEADVVEQQATGEALKDVTIFDLIASFRKVLSDIERNNIVHRVGKVETTIEKQCEFVLYTLQHRGKQNFMQLCHNISSKVIVVVTFLAVLEMIKEQQINLFVEGSPTNFYIDLKPVDEIIGA